MKAPSADDAGKASVFISYSRRDTGFAESLHAALVRDGRKAWLDSEDIRPAAQWSQEIAAAIDAADAIVFVLSPAFAASSECEKEIEHAKRQNKRLVPVVARAVAPPEVAPALAAVQWISFDGESFEAAFAKLVQAVDTDLEWVTDHTRYHLRALEWESRQRPSSLVLRKKELAEAERWLAGGAGKKPPPSLLQGQFIAAGRHAATRTQRIVAGALTIGLLIAIGLAVVAMFQRNAARSARDDAVRNLFTLQLSRAADLVNQDPGRAVEIVEGAYQLSGGVREFPSELYRRLGNRVLLALGGIWNRPNTTADDAAPVVALSPDGRYLATGLIREVGRWISSEDEFVSEVLVWDVESGARRSTLVAMSGDRRSDARVQSLAFSPDGLRLAAVSGFGTSTVKVWDVPTGREVLTARSQFLQHVWLTGDAVIGVETHGEISLWELARPERPAQRFTGGYVNASTLTAEAGGLFVVEPAHVTRWTFSNGRRDTWPHPVRGDRLDISSDGRRLARINFDVVDIWKAEDPAAAWKREWTLERGHAENVTQIAFSPDGRTLATGGNDAIVRLWDLQRGVATMTLRGPLDDVTALTFSNDGRRLAAGAADATVFVWDVAGPPERPEYRVQIQAVDAGGCFAFSGQGDVVALAPDGRTVLHSRAGRTREIAGPAGTEPRRCGLSDDGSIAFQVDGGSQVRLWNEATQASTVVGPVSDPRQVRLSDRGQVLAAFAGPDRLAAWDARSGAPLGTMDAGGALGLPFEFVDESLVAVSVVQNGGSRLTLFDVTQNRALASAAFELKDLQASAVCRHQRLVAMVEHERLLILDLAAGRAAHDVTWYDRSLFSHLRRTTALVFSPDCSTLLLGDDVGEITIWDVPSKRAAGVIAAHAGTQLSETRGSNRTGVSARGTASGVTALAFSPDGRTVASSGGSPRGRGEVRLWDVRRGERLADLATDSGFATALKFSRDGRALSIVHRPSSEHGSPERIVEVWHSQRGAELHLIAAHAAPITRLMFSADGSRLFSGTEDEARAWSVADGTAVVGAAGWDTSGSDGKVAQSVDGKTRVEFADEALLIYRHGAYAPDILRPDKGGPLFHRQPIASVRMLRDGRVVSLATARSDNNAAELVIWDVERAEALKKAFVHTNIVAALVVAPDERTFVTTGAVGPVLAHAGTVHVWNTSELRPVASLVGHGSRVQAAAFSPDGKLLATGDIRGFVRLWDLSDAMPGDRNRP